MTDLLQRNQTTSDPPAMVEIDVTGMTCASCVRRVERALGKVPGVETANVNLATHRATVSFDPAAASVAELTGAIDRAGYGTGAVVDPNAPVGSDT